MDALFDVALLSRIQFAVTVAYHFIFVPLSIGLGLITAIFATKIIEAAMKKMAPLCISGCASSRRRLPLALRQVSPWSSLLEPTGPITRASR